MACEQARSYLSEDLLIAEPVDRRDREDGTAPARAAAAPRTKPSSRR